MAVTFQDGFADTAGTALDAHTPDTLGTAWNQRELTGTQGAEIHSSGVLLSAAGNDASDRHLYTSDAASEVEYDVEFGALDMSGNSDDFHTLIGRWTDNSNMYGGGFYHKSAAADSKLWKEDAAVVSELASGDFTPDDGQSHLLEIRDASKKLYLNTVEILSSTDNNLTSAGSPGYGQGNFLVSSDDIIFTRTFDDYSVDEVVTGGGLGIPIVMHHRTKNFGMS